MKVVHQATVIWSAASKFYLLTECRHTRSSVKVKRDVGRIGGWGGGVESNLPSRRRWTRSYFNFNSGGCNFILRPTLLILDPPSR